MTTDEFEILAQMTAIGEQLGLTLQERPEYKSKKICLMATSPCMDMESLLLRSVVEVGRSNNTASDDERMYLVLFDRLEYDDMGAGSYHVVISEHMEDLMVDNPDPEALARFNGLTKPSHQEVLLTQVDLSKLKAKLEAFMVNLHECEQQYNAMSISSAKDALEFSMYEARREQRARKKAGTA